MLILLLPGPLLAPDGPAGAAPECRCRYFGAYYGLGETVCFRTPEGPRIARCTLVQNVTSWEVGRRACPAVSRREPPVPP